MSNFIAGASAFVGSVFIALGIVGIALHACAPGQLRQDEVQPAETVITLDIETENPCKDKFTVYPKFCFDPDGGSWGGGWYERCFEENFQASWEPENATFSFRTALPYCESHFAVGDSSCEWLHEPYSVHTDYDTQGQFWEVLVSFSEDFAGCVSQYETWYIEFEMCVICPEL